MAFKIETKVLNATTVLYLLQLIDKKEIRAIDCNDCRFSELIKRLSGLVGGQIYTLYKVDIKTDIVYEDKNSKKAIGKLKSQVEPLVNMAKYIDLNNNSKVMSIGDLLGYLKLMKDAGILNINARIGDINFKNIDEALDDLGDKYKDIVKSRIWNSESYSSIAERHLVGADKIKSMEIKALHILEQLLSQSVYSSDNGKIPLVTVKIASLGFSERTVNKLCENGVHYVGELLILFNNELDSSQTYKIGINPGTKMYDEVLNKARQLIELRDSGVTMVKPRDLMNIQKAKISKNKSDRLTLQDKQKILSLINEMAYILDGYKDKDTKVIELKQLTNTIKSKLN